MILATMQPIHAHEQSIAMRDGVIKTTQEDIEQVSGEVYSITKGVKLGHSEGFISVNDKIVCLVSHPINDVCNRKRLAIIVWDKNTPQSEIEKTFTQIGIPFAKYQELEREFSSKKNNKKLIVLGLTIITAVVLYLAIK